MADRQALLERRVGTGSPRVDRAEGLQEGGMKKTEKFEKIQFRDCRRTGRSLAREIAEDY